MTTQAAQPILSEAILTPAAVAFVTELSRVFGARVRSLLVERERAQARYDAGELPDFDMATADIRAGDWTCAPVPTELRDRRVEITGPVDRKMIINALNSGANVFMADFEDSTSPTWKNIIEGHRNLRDAVRGTIGFTHPVTGRHYALAERTAVLFVRPRGWHLVECNFQVDDRPISASLFDFGLFFFHNAQVLLERGSAPYFYLPKLQSHREAALWNDVFVFAQSALGIPNGTLRATVLIETLPAAFQMDEILYALRDHSAGLNCGRWDYIFSAIKTVRAHADRVLPDRDQIGMTQPFMRAYTQQLVRICHRRGVHAMGGMAAQIPIKGDSGRNAAALDKVRGDKRREVEDGHDGTWVAHPGLVGVAREVFDQGMPTPNQIARQRPECSFEQKDLLAVPTGTKTLDGLRHSLRVGVQYLEAWLRGSGCVPLYDVMEDAATAEICRAQVWQWVHHGVTLDDGVRVDAALVQQLLTEEIGALSAHPGSRLDEAARLFSDLCTAHLFTEFLTLPAYDRLQE